MRPPGSGGTVCATERAPGPVRETGDVMTLRLVDNESVRDVPTSGVPATAQCVNDDTYLFDITVRRPDLRADIHAYAVARRMQHAQMWELWDGEYRTNKSDIEPDVEASTKLRYGCYRTLVDCEARLLERLESRYWERDDLWVSPSTAAA